MVINCAYLFDKYISRNGLSGMQYNDRRYSDLQGYVGKTFYPDINGYTIVCLLGGEVGQPYFLCAHVSLASTVCLTPLEVILHFDDNKMPIRDVNYKQSRKIFDIKNQN